MRLVQFREPDGRRAVAASDGDGEPVRLHGAETTYELALEAIETGRPLADIARDLMTGHQTVDLDAAEEEGRLLAPLEHPVPTRCWVTGTGLTHLGSAEARDRMHAKLAPVEGGLSDSMKLFKWGLERGRPAEGDVGVQPEWFFRGNGASLVASGQALTIPEFSLDGGEEPEVVALYVIADDGTPCRVGWSLGNDFTDHLMERQNYLYLAHSKLRPTAIGPELLLGELPADVRGTTRIFRGEKALWEKPFSSGDANMSHSMANLEHHHFKYPMFRRPGDVHLHFLGTSTVSAADGIMLQAGDRIEISAAPFGHPLRNRVETSAGPPVPKVRVL
jgi:hypothetical protein